MNHIKETSERVSICFNPLRRPGSLCADSRCAIVGTHAMTSRCTSPRRGSAWHKRPRQQTSRRKSPLQYDQILRGTRGRRISRYRGARVLFNEQRRVIARFNTSRHHIEAQEFSSRMSEAQEAAPSDIEAQESSSVIGASAGTEAQESSSMVRDASQRVSLP